MNGYVRQCFKNLCKAGRLHLNSFRIGQSLRFSKDLFESLLNLIYLFTSSFKKHAK